MARAQRVGGDGPSSPRERRAGAGRPCRTARRGHRLPDGGARRSRQRRRGAARLRGAARAAARRARRRAGAGGAGAAPAAARGRAGAVGRARPAPPVRVPLPALLSPRERGAFVGRERELERLRAGVGRPRAGTPPARAARAASRASARRAWPASSRARRTPTARCSTRGCQEEALVSYQPFVEALRHYAAATGRRRHAPLGPGRARARAADPRAGRRIAGPEPGRARRSRDAPLPDVRGGLVAAHRGVGRARRCCSCSTTCTGPTGRRSSCCATSCARQHEAPLLIVGTYREGEMSRRASAGRAARRPAARPAVRARRRSSGLDAARRRRADRPSHAGHAGAVGARRRRSTRETEGNPFFVEEVVRHLIETGVLFERGGRWTSALTATRSASRRASRRCCCRRLGAPVGDVPRAALAGRRARPRVLLRRPARDGRARARTR